MEMTVTNPTDTCAIPPSEQIADGIFRVGGTIPLDGRVSWAPTLTGKWQPLNAYLVLEDDRSYMLDTSVAAHGEIVVEELRKLVPRDKPLSIFLTRAEYMTAGNISPIHAEFGVEELVASTANPFAATQELAADLQATVRKTRLNIAIPESPVGSSTRMIAFPSQIRVLSTYFVYDAETKTLFTSDMFGHTSTDADCPSVIIDDVAHDTSTKESVADHWLQRYFWVPVARTTTMIDWLQRVFDTHDIETVAPDYGMVLKGRPVIEKHVGHLIDIMRDARTPEEDAR